jgi:hypothetical protein
MKGLQMLPIFTEFLALEYMFTPYGDYLKQASFFVKNSAKCQVLHPDTSGLLDYSASLAEVREIFMKAKDTSKDYGGYVFIDFSPTADDKEAMQAMPFDYDIFALWFFDLIENDYQWKWALDEKNHCLKGQLSCVDEGSPNYKKMVSFRHIEPTKIMMMAYYYDTVYTEGIWEHVDKRTVNW